MSAIGYLAGAHPRAIELARYGQEIRQVKHPFRNDIEPQPGMYVGRLSVIILVIGA